MSEIFDRLKGKSARLNLYTDAKLQDEHYIGRLNEVALPHGYKVDTVLGIFIQDNNKRQYARVDYRGKDFMVNTTSSTYTVNQAMEYSRELVESFMVAQELNVVLEEIKEEIFIQYANEEDININE